MRLKFQALLNITSIKAEPDSFAIEKQWSYPDKDFVISRNASGDVISTFADDIWDLTPYSTIYKTTSKLIFSTLKNGDNPCSDSQVLEAKKLVFILMYLPATGRAGYLSVTTLYIYKTMIFHLCRYAAKTNQNVCEIISEDQKIRKFLVEATFNTSQIGCLASMIRQLHQLGEQLTGVKVVSAEARKEVYKQARTMLNSANYCQTPIIPNQIYHSLIGKLFEVVKDFNKHFEMIQIFAEKAGENPAFARAKTHVKRRHSPTDFPQAIALVGLGDYCERNKIANIAALGAHLYIVQTACKCLVMAYTGMRSSEADSLKYECVEKELSSSGKIIRLVGETTKFVGSRKKVRWITSSEIDEIIQAAQRLADLTIPFTKLTKDECPLFVTMANLPFIKSTPTHCPTTISDLSYRTSFKNFFEESLVISKTDIEEMKKYNPFHDWESDADFAVGALWPLASHQFRRSLAVYAAQSGLVTLPALKRQLKHITREMTLYYVKGSANLDDLCGRDSEHIRFEMSKIKPEADAMAYIYNVLLTDEPIRGGHGEWLNKHAAAIATANVLENRDDIINRFKKGEIAYSETPLGACTSSQICSKKAMRAVSACLNCEKSIIKQAHLQHVIAAQTELVQRLDPESMIYRMENEQLKDLQRFEIKFA